MDTTLKQLKEITEGYGTGSDLTVSEVQKLLEVRGLYCNNSLQVIRQATERLNEWEIIATEKGTQSKPYRLYNASDVYWIGLYLRLSFAGFNNTKKKRFFELYKKIETSITKPEEYKKDTNKRARLAIWRQELRDMINIVKNISEKKRVMSIMTRQYMEYISKKLTI